MTTEKKRPLKLTMEETCFVCGKKQAINEPFTIFELQNCHISFCSSKCEKRYNYFQELNQIAYNQGYEKAKKEDLEIIEEEIKTYKKRMKECFIPKDEGSNEWAKGFVIGMEHIKQKLEGKQEGKKIKKT